MQKSTFCFLIQSEAYRNQLGLLIVLATKYLYVGLVSLRKDTDGQYITGHDSDMLSKIIVPMISGQYKECYGKSVEWIERDVDAGFKNYRVWRLESQHAALDLDDFDNSELKKVIDNLIALT